MIVQLIDITEVAKQRAVSVSKAWLDAKTDPEHPRPLRQGPRNTRWVQSEISRYLIKQMARRDGVPADQIDGYVAAKLAGMS
jgi:predicted DNA-binding transcriptional regulator AlpA